MYHYDCHSPSLKVLKHITYILYMNNKQQTGHFIMLPSTVSVLFELGCRIYPPSPALQYTAAKSDLFRELNSSSSGPSVLGFTIHRSWSWSVSFASCLLINSRMLLAGCT